MSTGSHRADVFISHASEDKREIARPLAEMLRSNGLAVWYDEYELQLGDSLRQVIDSGLNSCRFGVVILSPAFFSKEWPRRELNGLLARETQDGVKVLLPIWHNVTADDVLRFSPPLADKLAVSTRHGLRHAVESILNVLQNDERPLSAGTEFQQASKPPGESVPTEPVPPKSQRAPTTVKKVQGTTGRKRTLERRQAPRRYWRTPWFVWGFVTVILALTLLLIGTTVGIPRFTKETSQGDVIFHKDVIPPDSKPGADANSVAVLKILHELRTRQVIVADILIGISASLPELLWLERLTVEPEATELEGRAFNVNAISYLIENVDRLPEFLDPRLGPVTDGRDTYSFSVTLQNNTSVLMDRLDDGWTDLGELDRPYHLLAGPTEVQDLTSRLVREIRSVAESAEVSLTGLEALAAERPAEQADLNMRRFRLRFATSYGHLLSFFEELRSSSRILSPTHLTVTATETKDEATLLAEVVLDTPLIAYGDNFPPGSHGADSLGPRRGSNRQEMINSKRDPLRSLSTNSSGKRERSSRPEGVPGLLIDKLRVTGIFRTQEGYVAAVKSVENEKSFLLKEGDELYDAEVVRILADEILFERIIQGPTDRNPRRKVVLELGSTTQ